MVVGVVPHPEWARFAGVRDDPGYREKRKRMISITRLCCGQRSETDSLRYEKRPEIKPIVVWNCTKACNLKCVHCYADARAAASVKELSAWEATEFIRDIAAYGAPVLLFSGGEPLMRKDIFELSESAVALGLRIVLSTNGTLITKQTAKKLKNARFSYIGVSLDGAGSVNDEFRGVKGAFRRALEGIRNSAAAGLKVGLRFTITKKNLGELPGIFDLVEREPVDRCCFYHLVYTGRGRELMGEAPSPQETRNAIDYIVERTIALSERRVKREVLTVDNHCDGVHLYLKVLKDDPSRAKEVLDLLKISGGNRTGEGIACVGWDGDVYPDQFWRNHPVGNIREKPFSRIWEGEPGGLLEQLRNRKSFIKGRCASCRWFDICRGNFRARAEAAAGDMWDFDPACYLTDKEVMK